MANKKQSAETEAAEQAQQEQAEQTQQQQSEQGSKQEANVDPYEGADDSPAAGATVEYAGHEPEEEFPPPGQESAPAVQPIGEPEDQGGSEGSLFPGEGQPAPGADAAQQEQEQGEKKSEKKS
jgi:hypothetical protein